MKRAVLFRPSLFPPLFPFRFSLLDERPRVPGIKDVLEQVSSLFADHPDLLREFTYFLPDPVQEQARERLNRAARYLARFQFGLVIESSRCRLTVRLVMT